MLIALFQHFFLLLLLRDCITRVVPSGRELLSPAPGHSLIMSDLKIMILNGVMNAQ